MAMLACLKKVFDGAAASEMLVATMDSNFHWEEQFHAAFGTSGSFLSFAMVCRTFEPMESLFSDECEPDAATMYALYLVCKKFAAHFFLGEEQAGSVAVGGGCILPIPLAAPYRTMDKKRHEPEKRRLLTGAEQLALEHVMMDDARAGGYARVHITLMERNEEEGDWDGSRKGVRRMECFTLERHVLEEVAKRAGQEALEMEKMQAFCMGLHARLGEQSLIHSHLDEDLGKMICGLYSAAG